jgi:hypothetical protein
MAKKDRRYQYPKGYIDKRTGKAKTGFMSAKQGARVYVKGNLEAIKRGDIPYESLTTREKQVFKGFTNPSQQNTFYFEKERIYDPSGTLRKILDQNPVTEGRKKLDNLITPQMAKTLFEGQLPAQAEKVDTWNLSQKRFKDGKKIPYITRQGDNLDVISRLSRYFKRGYKIKVDGSEGKDALEKLRKFEQREIQKALKDKKSGNVQVWYQDITFNPADNEIIVDTDNVEIQDFDDTP